jgi:hypothetical protein
MRPPGFREADRNIVGMAKKGCFECQHERQFNGRSVCLKYAAWVQIYKTCDEWNGGELVGNAPHLGLFGGFYYHERSASSEERLTLESSEITET